MSQINIQFLFETALHTHEQFAHVCNPNPQNI